VDGKRSRKGKGRQGEGGGRVPEGKKSKPQSPCTSKEGGGGRAEVLIPKKGEGRIKSPL